MRILHVSTPLSWRGGEQQIAYLIDELQKKNIFQKVLCPKGSVFHAYLKENQVPHFAFKKRGGVDPLLAADISMICKRKKIDIVHLHDAHAHTAGVISAAFLGNRTPMVLHRRVDFPVKDNFFSRWKYNHSSIKRIICVSEAIRNLLAPDIKDKSKLAIIHSGVDLERFSAPPAGILRREYSLPEETVLVGNVAAIADHKDPHTFLRTAEILKGRINARFFIIGDGPMRAEIEKAIAERGLRDVVFITGFRSDIPEILPELDVFLFTSKTEGLGTSVLDAFAAGVPVVATNAGGIPEIVTDEETGLLAPVKDAKQLAENVFQVLNDLQLKERLVQNAKQAVQAFSKEAMAEKVLAVYKEIIR